MCDTSRRYRAAITIGVLGANAMLASMSAPASAQSLLVPALHAAALATMPANDSTDVARTVERFHDALARGDSAGALALLAPDATILESGGTESVADYRAHHLPADIEFARAVKSVRASARVTVRGDVAWVTATSSTQGTFQGRPVNSVGVELMVLTRAPDGWRIVAIHWSSRRRSA
jgi:ketosteroid isomerase-like protein